MAERRVGTITNWRQLSPPLALFRLHPEPGRSFPEYRAGQYIALRRDDCRLTRRVVEPDGRVRYVPDLDEWGRQRRGPVTHSYSICSAPYETRHEGHLEFYVVLEMVESLGRFTESLFGLDPREGSPLGYVEHITGTFTLERRAAGFRNVLLVGTGTGLAPFASMVRQLHHEAGDGAAIPWRVTLLHANRSRAELAYHEELSAIEAARRFDFAYVVSLSRPPSGAPAANELGRGRATNLLRHVFGMPLKEEQDLAGAEEQGAERAPLVAALEKAVRPALPPHVAAEALRERLDPSSTVILTCGNPAAMADVQRVAEAQGIRFEKEEW